MGPTEILVKGRDGKLVTSANAEALSSGILTTLGEEPDVEALKKRAKDFSLEIIARQYLDVMFP